MPGPPARRAAPRPSAGSPRSAQQAFAANHLSGEGVAAARRARRDGRRIQRKGASPRNRVSTLLLLTRRHSVVHIQGVGVSLSARPESAPPWPSRFRIPTWIICPCCIARRTPVGELPTGTVPSGTRPSTPSIARVTYSGGHSALQGSGGATSNGASFRARSARTTSPGRSSVASPGIARWRRRAHAVQALRCARIAARATAYDGIRRDVQSADGSKQRRPATRATGDSAVRSRRSPRSSSAQRSARVIEAVCAEESRAHGEGQTVGCRTPCSRVQVDR